MPPPWGALCSASISDSCHGQERCTSYRTALSVDRGSAAAEFGLGRLALAKGELEESQKHLERAAEIAPEAGSIQATLSRLYRRLGREKEASKTAARARRLHPDIDVRDPVLASVMEEAVSLAGYQTRALMSDPDRPNAHYALGRALAAPGKLDETIEHFLKALEGAPDRGEIHLHLAALHAKRGEHRAAEREIQLARTYGTTPPEELRRPPMFPSKPPE